MFALVKSTYYMTMINQTFTHAHDDAIAFVMCMLRYVVPHTESFQNASIAGVGENKMLHLICKNLPCYANMLTIQSVCVITQQNRNERLCEIEKLCKNDLLTRAKVAYIPKIVGKVVGGVMKEEAVICL